MPRIVVVCGYGCHLTPELTNYLDEVCRYLNENDWNHLILCGGPTQKLSAPGKTEAGVMAKYIFQNVIISTAFDVSDHGFLEVDSYTTLENIRGASKIIDDKWLFDDGETHGPINPTEIKIFCEASRAPKVRLIAWYFFSLKKKYKVSYRIEIKKVKWEKAHPIFQLVSTVAEVIALFIPRLATYFRNKRIKRAEKI